MINARKFAKNCEKWGGQKGILHTKKNSAAREGTEKLDLWASTVCIYFSLIWCYRKPHLGLTCRRWIFFRKVTKILLFPSFYHYTSDTYKICNQIVKGVRGNGTDCSNKCKSWWKDLFGSINFNSLRYETIVFEKLAFYSVLKINFCCSISSIV